MCATQSGMPVNRTSRKPFYWGGLKGYQQLEVIADVLYQMKDALAEIISSKVWSCRWIAF